MPSSFETFSSFSDDDEEYLQDAQLSDEQREPHRINKQSDERPGIVDLRATEIPRSARASAKAPQLTEEEREKAILEHATKFAANVERDAEGKLQPVYDRHRSGLFSDKPSGELWRYRTTFERDIAVNLERTRASDLSIHLYNVFAIGQRAKSQIADENGFVETKVPPKNWAAWPETQSNVPRSYLERPWDDDNWRIGPYVKKERMPGDELRELLTARATKTGKDRFLQRDSEDSPSETESDGDLRPTISVNDEAIGKTLHSSTQHLLTRLDNLLVALHHARASYVAPLPGRRKGSLRGPYKLGKRSSGDEDSDETSNIGLDAGETKKSKRKLARDLEPEDVTAKRRMKFIQRKVHTRGLRDWTDIVGVASMAALSPAAVNKTTSRCVDLFSEQANFRTISGAMTNEQRTFYLPHTSTLHDIGALKDPQGELHEGLHVDGFLKTIPNTPYWAYFNGKAKAQKSAVKDSNVVDEAEGRSESENKVGREIEEESVNENARSDDDSNVLSEGSGETSDEFEEGDETSEAANLFEDQIEGSSDPKDDVSNGSEDGDETEDVSEAD